MKDEQNNRKKSLSDEELLKVSGGHGQLPDLPCSTFKKQKNCEGWDGTCVWDEATSTCKDKPATAGKHLIPSSVRSGIFAAAWGWRRCRSSLSPRQRGKT